MKARITFILDGDAEFDPSQLKVTETSLNVAQLPVAIREDRISFGLDEIEAEVRTALEQVHELHLRWQSPESMRTPAPYSSRVSPGLHVFYTPSRRPDT